MEFSLETLYSKRGMHLTIAIADNLIEARLPFHKYFRSINWISLIDLVQHSCRPVQPLHALRWRSSRVEKDPQ